VGPDGGDFQLTDPNSDLMNGINYPLTVPAGSTLQPVSVLFAPRFMPKARRRNAWLQLTDKAGCTVQVDLAGTG